MKIACISGQGSQVAAAIGLAEGLVRQVSAPVRWLEAVETLVREGVDSVIEVGPGLPALAEAR